MPKIYYVFDVLCGWCYGFSPIIKSLFEEYRDRFEFEVISGGMVTGERVGPIAPMAAYIREALPRVTAATGTAFGEAFVKDILDQGDVIQDSLPPSRLLSAVKSIDSSKALPFASALQKAIYYDGVYPTDMEKLAQVGEEVGIEPSMILDLAQTEEMELAAKKDFEQSTAWGVRGFPTVLGQKNGQLYLLAHGAEKKEKLRQTFDSLLAI